jgi:hypothetical protein
MEFDLHGLRTQAVRDVVPGSVITCSRGTEPFLGIVGLDSSGGRFLVDLLPSQGDLPELLMINGFEDTFCLAASRAYIQPDFSAEFVEPGVAASRIRPGELAIHENRLLLCFIVSRTMGRGYMDVRTGELVDMEHTAARVTRLRAWKLYQWASEQTGVYAPVLRAHR